MQHRSCAHVARPASTSTCHPDPHSLLLLLATVLKMKPPVGGQPFASRHVAPLYGTVPCRATMYHRLWSPFANQACMQGSGSRRNGSAAGDPRRSGQGGKLAARRAKVRPPHGTCEKQACVEARVASCTATTHSTSSRPQPRPPSSFIHHSRRAGSLAHLPTAPPHCQCLHTYCFHKPGGCRPSARAHTTQKSGLECRVCASLPRRRCHTAQHAKARCRPTGGPQLFSNVMK